MNSWPEDGYSRVSAEPFCVYQPKKLLLTPWSRVLLEKQIGLQLVKKFPAIHGTRRFITVLTSVRHLSLSWASPIQSIYPHPTSWKSILIVSTHLRLGLTSRLLPSNFSSKTLYTSSPHPYAPHAQPISFFSILSPAQYWVRSTNNLSPCYAISSIPRYLVLRRYKYSPQHHVLKHHQQLYNLKYLILITALQLLVQSFGLPNHFLPSSSILDKSLPVWYF